MKTYIRHTRHYKDHCILGDFNIDLMNVNNISQDFLSLFLENNFAPCFVKTTRPSDANNKLGTCINIFVKSNSINAKSYKLANLFNDHYSLFIGIDRIATKEINCEIDTIINYKKLNKLISKKDWNGTLSIQNPIMQLIILLTNCRI